MSLQKHVADALAAHNDVQERIKQLAVDTEPLAQQACVTEATLAECKKNVRKVEVGITYLPRHFCDHIHTKMKRWLRVFQLTMVLLND